MLQFVSQWFLSTKHSAVWSLTLVLSSLQCDTGSRQQHAGAIGLVSPSVDDEHKIRQAAIYESLRPVPVRSCDGEHGYKHSEYELMSAQYHEQKYKLGDCLPPNITITLNEDGTQVYPVQKSWSAVPSNNCSLPLHARKSGKNRLSSPPYSENITDLGGHDKTLPTNNCCSVCGSAAKYQHQRNCSCSSQSSEPPSYGSIVRDPASTIQPSSPSSLSSRGAMSSVSSGTMSSVSSCPHCHNKLRWNDGFISELLKFLLCQIFIQLWLYVSLHCPYAVYIYKCYFLYRVITNHHPRWSALLLDRAAKLLKSVLFSSLVLFDQYLFCWPYQTGYLMEGFFSRSAIFKYHFLVNVFFKMMYSLFLSYEI